MSFLAKAMFPYKIKITKRKPQSCTPQTRPTQSRPDPAPPPLPGTSGPQPRTLATSTSFGIPQAPPPTVRSRPPRGPHSRTSSACLQGAPPPQAWLPRQRVGEAQSLLGPTLPPVSRHQLGTLGFWKRPPSDQTPLASSIHTRQGRVPHLPAGAPVSAQGEGTPRTPPTSPRSRNGKRTATRTGGAGGGARPRQEQDRPREQT